VTGILQDMADLLERRRGLLASVPINGQSGQSVPSRETGGRDRRILWTPRNCPVACLSGEGT